MILGYIQKYIENVVTLLTSTKLSSRPLLFMAKKNEKKTSQHVKRNIEYICMCM